MGGIAFGVSNSVYKRVGWNNSTYRFCAFDTNTYIYTLSSYTSTWYNISSSQYSTVDSKYYVRSDAFVSQSTSSADNDTYSYSNSYVTEKSSALYVSSAFSDIQSYKSSSNNEYTYSYNNSYVKSFYRYYLSGSSYKTTSYYSGYSTVSYDATHSGTGTSTSVSYLNTTYPNVTFSIVYQASNRTYVSSRTLSGSSATTTDNYSADLYSTAYTRKTDSTRYSSYEITQSAYRSYQKTYYNITRSSYANRNSQYLVTSGTLTSSASKDNNDTYSYNNSYATKTY